MTCIVYCTGPNAYMVVHGTGTGHEMLIRSAQGRQVAVLFDDDLHDISLQGPVAVDFLAEHIEGIRDLPYFHHMQNETVWPPGDDLPYRLYRRTRLRNFL